MEIGTTLGIRPGDFFGPVSAAHCLKEALQTAVEAGQIPEMLRIYITQDSISKNSSLTKPKNFAFNSLFFSLSTRCE